MRPRRFCSVQLVTGEETNSELGTTTDAESNVSISVARTEIRRTVPSVSPITTQSPTRIGRSISISRPATKFSTTVRRPKPMPTESAPATMAKLERLMPDGGDGGEERQDHAEIAGAGRDRGAQADLHPALRQDALAEPAAQAAGAEQPGGQHQDRQEDVGQRDDGVADLDVAERQAGPVVDLRLRDVEQLQEDAQVSRARPMSTNTVAQ